MYHVENGGNGSDEQIALESYVLLQWSMTIEAVVKYDGNGL